MTTLSPQAVSAIIDVVLAIKEVWTAPKVYERIKSDSLKIALENLSEVMSQLKENNDVV